MYKIIYCTVHLEMHSRKSSIISHLQWSSYTGYLSANALTINFYSLPTYATLSARLYQRNAATIGICAINPIQTGGVFDTTQDLNPLLLTNDCVYSIPTSWLFLKFTWEQFGVVRFW